MFDLISSRAKVHKRAPELLEGKFVRTIVFPGYCCLNNTDAQRRQVATGTTSALWRSLCFGHSLQELKCCVTPEPHGACRTRNIVVLLLLLEWVGVEYAQDTFRPCKLLPYFEWLETEACRVHVTKPYATSL